MPVLRGKHLHSLTCPNLEVQISLNEALLNDLQRLPADHAPAVLADRTASRCTGTASQRCSSRQMSASKRRSGGFAHKAWSAASLSTLPR